jgi:hypothetical protein
MTLQVAPPLRYVVFSQPRCISRHTWTANEMQSNVFRVGDARMYACYHRYRIKRDSAKGIFAFAC